MKKLSTLKLAACLAAFSAFALMGSANAQVLNENAIVNVQMGYSGPSGTDGTGLSMAGASYTSVTAGATPLAYNGSTWNVENQQTSGSNLAYSVGGGSGINYALSPSLDTFQAQVSNPNMPLLSNFVGDYNAGTPGTLVFSGLNNATAYDITIEAYSTAFWSGQFTLGASDQSLSGSGTLTSWVLDGDYVEFDNITPTSGTITITGANGASFENISGFQIGAVEASDVPEPSTMALMGLGGLAFLIIRRRYSLV